MKISALIVLLGLIGTSCSHFSKCHRHGKKDCHRYFEKMDKNEDGMISKKEWNAKSKKKFKRMDADGNGKISAEEWKMGKKKKCSKKKCSKSSCNKK